MAPFRLFRFEEHQQQLEQGFDALALTSITELDFRKLARDVISTIIPKDELDSVQKDLLKLDKYTERAVRAFLALHGPRLWDQEYETLDRNRVLKGDLRLFLFHIIQTMRVLPEKMSDEVFKTGNEGVGVVQPKREIKTYKGKGKEPAWDLEGIWERGHDGVQKTYKGKGKAPAWDLNLNWNTGYQEAMKRLNLKGRGKGKEPAWDDVNWEKPPVRPRRAVSCPGQIRCPPCPEGEATNGTFGAPEVICPVCQLAFQDEMAVTDHFARAH